MIDRDRALIERLKAVLAISPQMADYLTQHWAQTAALLSAARDEGRAEGLGGEWVLVPRVPTVEMLVAATEEWLCVRSQEDRAEFIWDAMLAAAPPASQTQEG